MLPRFPIDELLLEKYAFDRHLVDGWVRLNSGPSAASGNRQRGIRPATLVSNVDIGPGLEIGGYSPLKLRC